MVVVETSKQYTYTLYKDHWNITIYMSHRTVVFLRGTIKETADDRGAQIKDTWACLWS